MLDVGLQCSATYVGFLWRIKVIKLKFCDLILVLLRILYLKTNTLPKLEKSSTIPFFDRNTYIEKLPIIFLMKLIPDEICDFMASFLNMASFFVRYKFYQKVFSLVGNYWSNELLANSLRQFWKFAINDILMENPKSKLLSRRSKTSFFSKIFFNRIVYNWCEDRFNLYSEKKKLI